MYKRALTRSAVRVIDFAAFLDRNGSSRALSCYAAAPFMGARERRSEEHTSELQSLMRISYAVFCLKKKKQYMSTAAYHQSTNNSPHTAQYTKLTNISNV